MSKYSKLGKNIGLISIGSFSSKLLNIFFIPFYTSILSTAEYGIADIIMTTVTLLFPVFSFVICEAMMRYALEDHDNAEQIYANGMLVWGIGTVLLAILSPVLCCVEAFKGNIVIFVFYYLSYSLYFNLSYFSRGIEKIGVYTLAGIVQTVVAIILNIVFLAVLRWGLKGYLLAYFVADLIAALVIFIGAKMYQYHLYAINKELLKKMLLLSAPMIPTQMCWWITNSSDKYMLLFLSGSALAGIYSISYKIPSIMNVLIGIFSSAWRISSVDGYGTEDNRRFYVDVYQKYFTISILLGAMIELFNKFLAFLLYSNDFYLAYRFVPILIMAAIINGFSDFVGSVYIAAKKTKMLFFSTVLGAVSNVILNFLLIPLYGAYGAAIATLTSYCIMWIMRLAFCKNFVRLSIDSSREYVSLFLIAVEVVLVSLDKELLYFISIILFIVIVVINKEVILHILESIKISMRKRRKQND